MKRRWLRQIVWLVALLSIALAAFSSPTIVLAQGVPPVDPTGPAPGTEGGALVPVTGGQVNGEDEGFSLTGWTLPLIIVAMFVVVIIGLLIGDGYVNRVD